MDEPFTADRIYDPSRMFIACHGGKTIVIVTKGEVQELIERMLNSSGRWIDLSQPLVDACQGHQY